MKKCALLTLVVILSLPGCRGGVAEKLQEALSSSVDSVEIGDENVVAVCKESGEKITFPTAELELNALGLADIEKLTAAAQKIKNGCENIVRAKRDAENQRAALEQKAKDLKIKTEGKSDADIQSAICDEVKKKLPLRGEKRLTMIRDQNAVYGCPDPGDPVLPKWGFWEVDKEGTGKGAKVSLKLDSDDDGGGVVDRLALRCAGNKLDAYLASTEKLGNGPLLVKLGSKNDKWKTKLSSDKKAAFLPDIKKNAAAIGDAEVMELKYKTAKKKTVTRTFTVKGFKLALAQLPKACRP